jgi:putative transposase
MKRSKFSDSQILAVLKQAEVGTAVPDLCRRIWPWVASP